MIIITTIILVLVGWLVGIAINHAADILPTRTTVASYPSCTNCGTQRPHQRWSALVSLFAGQSTCIQCGSPRHAIKRSVVVELITPIFFVFLLWWYGLSPYFGLVSIYTTILILVTVTDLEHRLIFNIVILPAILLAIAAAFVTPGLSWRSALLGGVTAFIIVYVAVLASRGGLGEGDVTLSTFLGFIMGFPYILLSLVFGVFLGGFVAVALLISGRVSMKTFIPYGPFLTITGWIMLVWGDEIWQYYFS